MRTLPSSFNEALQKGVLVIRDFLWITARNRTTGDPVSDGFWSDVGTITADVAHPVTGTATRTFYGAGGLIEIDNIPAVTAVHAETMNIKVSQLNTRIRDLLLGYDAKQAIVELYVGLYNSETGELIDQAQCTYMGFIETLEVVDDVEDAYTQIVCSSPAQEFNRYNSETRSNAYQMLRSATDNFFQDVEVMHELEFFWGSNKGKPQGGAAPKPPFSGGGGVPITR